jgi:Predicted 3'-5' exonuclease related to the exonuclease domain of PolB
MNTKPSASRRNVVLNIETVTANPSDPRGTVSAYARRVVCISMLVDDGISIIEHSFVSLDEGSLLRQFWECVNPEDLFIGQNSLEFELSFVRQRSWIVGIKPSSDIDLRRFYSHDLIDIMHMRSKWGATLRPGLEGLDDVLGLRGKTARASKVAKWWVIGDLDSIAAYCREGVRLTFQVFLKLTFQALPDRYNRSVLLAEEARNTEIIVHCRD